jgi:hypothetical protein
VAGPPGARRVKALTPAYGPPERARVTRPARSPLSPYGIPATGTEYFTTNIEDGVALADTGLRDAFAAAYPAAWARIQARRRFMNSALGIDLHPDVLPFSSIPAYLPPFLLRPDHVMTVAG